MPTSRPTARPPRRPRAALCALAALCAFALTTLGGCAAGVGSVAGAALEMVGLRKPALPELPDAQKPPRTIAIRLQAGDKLNADADGRPLALVTRIYKLRQTAAFEQASYDSFLTPQRERELLGADLLEVKELLLVPGQHYEAFEKVSREAYFIGVVALFRAPAPQRWRLAFAAGEAEQAGITVAVHACALSVGPGARPGGASAKSSMSASTTMAMPPSQCR